MPEPRIMLLHGRERKGREAPHLWGPVGSALDVGGEVVRDEARRAEVDHFDVAARIRLYEHIFWLEIALRWAHAGDTRMRRARGSCTTEALLLT